MKNASCVQKSNRLSLSLYIYPRTQMTLALIGKGLVLGGWPSKNKGHLGSRYIYIYKYFQLTASIPLLSVKFSLFLHLFWSYGLNIGTSWTSWHLQSLTQEILLLLVPQIRVVTSWSIGVVVGVSTRLCEAPIAGFHPTKSASPFAALTRSHPPKSKKAALSWQVLHVRCHK